MPKVAAATMVAGVELRSVQQQLRLDLFSEDPARISDEHADLADFSLVTDKKDMPPRILPQKLALLPNFHRQPLA